MAHVSLADTHVAEARKPSVSPFGADLVDPAVMDTSVVVIANGLEASIAYFANCRVFDFGFHHVLRCWFPTAYHMPCPYANTYTKEFIQIKCCTSTRMPL